jgi:hypothetical protein
MKVASTVVLSAALLVGLAGCTFSASAGVTVPKSQIATTAAKALQKSVGTSVAPKIDCGTGSTILTVGKKLNCTLTVPPGTTRYATVVTITKVNGLHYSVDAKVAKTPES